MPNFSSLAGLEVAEKFVWGVGGGGWGGCLHSHFHVKPNRCVVLCWGWGFDNIMSQIFSIKPIKLNLSTDSTKPNLEEPNLQKIKVKSNPCLFWAWPSSAPACCRILFMFICKIFGYWDISKIVLGVFEKTQNKLGLNWAKLRSNWNWAQIKLELGSDQTGTGLYFNQKTPKTVLLITQQPNIAQRPFCIQNERHDILYHLI